MRRRRRDAPPDRSARCPRGSRSARGRPRSSSFCASSGKSPRRNELSISCSDASAISGPAPPAGARRPRAPRPSSSPARSRRAARRRARRPRSTSRTRAEARCCARGTAGRARSRSSAAPRPRPGSASAEARACSSRSSTGTLHLLLAVAAGDPDQARLVGLEVEVLLVGAGALRAARRSPRRRSARGSTFEAVANWRARTPPPWGGIIVCWSQAASAPSLTRSQISHRRSR